MATWHFLACRISNELNTTSRWFLRVVLKNTDEIEVYGMNRFSDFEWQLGCEIVYGASYFAIGLKNIL